MPDRPNYEQLYASFRWNIPARYNIAADVCDRHATDPGKVALIGEDSDGKTWQMRRLPPQPGSEHFPARLTAS